jgi:hypothetical protein
MLVLVVIEDNELVKAYSYSEDNTDEGFFHLKELAEEKLGRELNQDEIKEIENTGGVKSSNWSVVLRLTDYTSGR